MTPLQEVHVRLRALLEPYAESLRIRGDSSTEYGLVVARAGREEFFATAKLSKSYAAFHLFPVYCYADLATQVPALLKPRMQGKSCFNFKRVDEAQLQALAELTRKAFERIFQPG